MTYLHDPSHPIISPLGKNNTVLSKWDPLLHVSYNLHVFHFFTFKHGRGNDFISFFGMQEQSICAVPWFSNAYYFGIILMLVNLQFSCDLKNGAH